MDAEGLIRQLALDGERIAALVAGVSAEQAQWRPAPESWSMLEVVNHLWDEEREDFRVRLNLILHDPATAWPPIDPKGWVTAHNYASRELGPSTSGFLTERVASLAWLKGLAAPDWDAKVETPWGWSITSGDMLAAWAAHDVLHMRQLVELHWGYTTQLAAPRTTIYAGDW